VDNPVFQSVSASAAGGGFVVAAGLLYWAWKRRRRRRQASDSEDSGQDSKMAKLITRRKDGSLPKSIDVFSVLERQTPKKWNHELERFVETIHANDDIRECLVEHGKSWKSHLYQFLTTKLAESKDFDVICYNKLHGPQNPGEVTSMKINFLALSISVLAVIDSVESFVRPDQRDESSALDESFALIENVCKSGSLLTQEPVMKLLLLRKVVSCLSQNLSEGTWHPHEGMDEFIGVMNRVLETVLAKDPQYDFSLDVKHGRFAAVELVVASRELIRDFLDKMPITPKNFDKRLSRASFGDPRDTSEAWKATKADDMKVEMEKRESALESGETVDKRPPRPDYDTTSTTSDDRVRALQALGSIMDALTVFMIATTERLQQRMSKKSRADPLRSVAYSSFATELQDTKHGYVLNTARLLADMTSRAKSKDTALEALVGAVERLELSQNLVLIHQLTTTVLRSHSPRLVTESAPGWNELQQLPKPQIAELETQITARNCVNDKQGMYNVALCGVPISLRVLHSNDIKRNVKEALLKHKDLAAASNYIVQTFGIGHSASYGSFVTVEYIPRTLADIIVSKPSLDNMLRAKLSVEISSGLAFLHSQNIYHRDVQPSSILVTNTFQVKIADFSLADDDHSGTLKTFQTRNTVMTRTGLYMAPERHVSTAEDNSRHKADTEWADAKSKSLRLAKQDVFSTAAVLVELLSASQQRLEHSLPRDLVSHYKESMRRARIDLTSPTKGNLTEDRKLAPAFELKTFEVESKLLPTISKAISLDPARRPSMSEFRDELAVAVKSMEDNQDSEEFRLMTAEQVSQIDMGLSISNLIKGTTNVYRISLFGGSVAVKTFGSGKLSESLKDEIRILQAFSEHPFIVRLFGIGFSERFGWFFCMEYVPNTLESLCFRETPLPILLRIQMAMDMAIGFSFLHSMGIFHRDIKPLNVLVTNDFRIRICDFGISSIMRRGSDDEKRTKTVAHAGVLGTPLYMAPEQHIGGADLKRLSPLQSQKIDVYGFGVLLLEFFSGMRITSALEAESLQQYYRSQTKIQGIEGEKRAFRSKSMDAKVPVKLLSIIDKCCAFDPALRPNMLQVHDELETILHRWRDNGLADSKDRKGAAGNERIPTPRVSEALPSGGPTDGKNDDEEKKVAAVAATASRRRRRGRPQTSTAYNGPSSTAYNGPSSPSSPPPPPLRMRKSSLGSHNESMSSRATPITGRLQSERKGSSRSLFLDDNHERVDPGEVQASLRCGTPML